MPNQILQFCFAAALNVTEHAFYLLKSDTDISKLESQVRNCNASITGCAPRSFSKQSFWRKQIDCNSATGVEACNTLQLFRADQPGNVNHRFEECVISQLNKQFEDISFTDYTIAISVVIACLSLAALCFTAKKFYDSRQQHNNNNARQYLLQQANRRPQMAILTPRSQ